MPSPQMKMMSLLPMERLHKLGGVVELHATWSMMKMTTAEAIPPSKRIKVRIHTLHDRHMEARA